VISLRTSLREALGLAFKLPSSPESQAIYGAIFSALAMVEKLIRELPGYED
jgi:hypothetical protein